MTSQKCQVDTSSVQYVQWWCYSTMIENITIDINIQSFNMDVDVKNINQCPTSDESARMYSWTVQGVQCLWYLTAVESFHSHFDFEILNVDEDI